MRPILTISILAACIAGCEATSPVHFADSGSDAASAQQSAIAPPAAPIAGDAERGRIRSGELYCDACHGTNGNSETPEWPSLAGQNAEYLVRQMELLRSGERPSPEMQPIAATLSDTDISDLAVHYAAQTATIGDASGAEIALGESLYREGDQARAIPACSSCHGPTGSGDPTTGDPAVRGQQPVYSGRQLEAYANRTRYASGAHEDANLQIMYEVAAKLTPEEIRSLAAYMYSMP